MKRLIALAIIFILISATLCSCNFHNHEPIGYTKYTVKRGDTLWALAAMSNGYGELDTRCIIDDIKAESNCTADLRVGQTIYIPEYDI
jgi:hypothetical protein